MHWTRNALTFTLHPLNLKKFTPAFGLFGLHHLQMKSSSSETFSGLRPMQNKWNQSWQPSHWTQWTWNEKQAMIKLQGMAEHGFSILFNYQCFTLLLNIRLFRSRLSKMFVFEWWASSLILQYETSTVGIWIAN